MAVIARQKVTDCVCDDQSKNLPRISRKLKFDIANARPQDVRALRWSNHVTEVFMSKSQFRDLAGGGRS
jgi:hypothetical protein